MSENILDDEKSYAKFRKPVTLKVNRLNWEKTCDDLQKRSTIGTFIFLAFGVIVSVFFGGIMVLAASVGFAIFLNIGVRRRFNDLRSLKEHRFTISSQQIVQIIGDQKQMIPFQKIQHIEFHNWGVEIDTKKNRKMADKDQTKGLIKIPRDVEEYGRVVATFKALEK